MADTGESLERFVKAVEEALLPHGFSVSIREKVFDEQGIQVAEFDVVVSGILGSTDIEWLIECRDRPSEGPAPASWIEQLTGRRTRFGFNKVTAVSTTGFSPAAQAYAIESGIELRSLHEISLDNLRDWFNVEEFKAHLRHADMANCSLFVSALGEPLPQPRLDLLVPPGPDTKFLIHTSTHDRMSLLDVWQGVLNQHPSLFEGISPGAARVRKSVDVNFTNPASRYMVEAEGQQLHVERISFEAEFYIEEYVVPINRVQEYSNLLEGSPIAQSVHYDFQVGQHTIELGFHRLTPPGSTGVYLQSLRAVPKSTGPEPTV